MDDVDYKKGTTTVGIVCKDGVVLAADRRATLGFLVSNKDVDKIFQITNKIAMTMAGSAADGQVLAKFLKAEMDLYRLNTGVEPSLTVAASLMSNIVFERAKSFIPYFVQLILAGEDETEFVIYSLDMGGSNIKEKQYASTGSGSPMAFGVLEDSYRAGISVEEGVTMALKAISSAIKRDVFTGQGIDVVTIDKNGFRRLKTEKVPELNIGKK